MKNIIYSPFMLLAVSLFLSCTAEASKSQRIFNMAARPAQIFEAVLYVENSSGGFSESYGYGGRSIDTPMLSASVGKLFTTACILMLCEEGRLSLDDKLILYFDEDELQGLHVFGGHEYSFDLSVYDLLFQTSGLPNSSRSLSDDDTSIAFSRRLSEVKNLTPHFAVNTGAVYYANINFFMLGEILVRVTEMPLSDVYEQMIFLPLGMNNTWLAAGGGGFVPHTYYGRQKINRPQNITSGGAAGGFVSTPRDLMVFSKAFWEGKLFDEAVFEQLAVYKRLKPYFGPVYYGGGYMRIPLKGFHTLFLGKGELLGHSGITGSFAFYYPQKDLHFTGDFAQLKRPSAPFFMLIRLAMSAKQ